MTAQSKQSLFKTFKIAQELQQLNFKNIVNEQNKIQNIEKQQPKNEESQNLKVQTQQKDKSQEKELQTQVKSNQIIQQEQKIEKKPQFQSKQIDISQLQHQQSQIQSKQLKQQQSPLIYQSCTKCQLNFSNQNIAILSQSEKYCQDCLQQILEQQQKQIKYKQERFIFYKEFQSTLDQNQVLMLNQEQLKKMTQDKQTIQMLEQQLKIIQQNMENTKIACQKLKNQVINMEIQQQKFWEQINRFDKRAIKLQQKALNAKFDKVLAKNQIQKISKTSIIHSFTKIQIDDNIGYILGLPMGKRAQIAEINWDDLNAGLGHICMALNYLTIKYGYEYTLIDKIKIKGSLTQILLKNKKQYCHLGYIGRQNQKFFGQMMQALLIQTLRLSELMQQVQKLQYSQQMRLPFKIDEKQGKVGQYYIDPSKIDDRKKWSQWTKSLRYFLINLKHLLTVYSISDNYL